jgi:hypothetical protein
MFHQPIHEIVACAATGCSRSRAITPSSIPHHDAAIAATDVPHPPRQH